MCSNLDFASYFSKLSTGKKKGKLTFQLFISANCSDCHLIEKQVLYIGSKPGFCQLFFKTEYRGKKEKKTLRLPPD